MTRDQIVAIAKERGHFRVSRYQWRDDKIREKCRQLERDGKLVEVSESPKDAIWYAPAGGDDGR